MKINIEDLKENDVFYSETYHRNITVRSVKNAYEREQEMEFNRIVKNYKIPKHLKDIFSISGRDDNGLIYCMGFKRGDKVELQKSNG